MSATPQLPWTKYVEQERPASPTAAAPKKPTRPSRASLGSSIAKLIQAARGGRGVDVERVAETIARRLDAGDPEGAQAVRNEARRVQRMTPAGSKDSGVVEWIEGAGTDELVLDDRCGRDLDRLARELAAVARFVAAGIDAPSRVLFFGPSGTGKTLAAKWLGARFGLPVALVRLDRVVDSHMGETASNLAAAFASATSVASILFLDEIDGMSVDRGSAGGDSAAGNEMRRATTSLLQQLDLCRPEQIVIAATNHPDHLDAALRRRFSTTVEFSLPDQGARLAMIRRWLERVDADADALEYLAELTEGMAGAGLRSVAMASARLALMADARLSREHVRSALAANGGES